MSRVKLAEYRAKSLLSKDYKGKIISLSVADTVIDELSDDQKFVIKVDQGIKKRGKQGLIRLNVTKKTAKKALKELSSKGYSRFIIEPMFPHEKDEERYLSIERLRDTMRILYSPNGGVDIEDHSENITQFDSIHNVPLPKSFLKHIIDVMNQEQFSFVEINPLVVRQGDVTLLDAAVLVDSAAEWQANWSEDDIVDAGVKTVSEQTIADLNASSPASFSFRILNPNGAIWLLLSGGGASITIADEAANRGKARIIGNYGEYSGGPTREETALYTDAVIRQLLASQASQKALIIAGGVANFTDVKKTFLGIIDTLSNYANELRMSKIKVYVRRGGPNETEGLAIMEEFLRKNNIYGSVHGSDAILTTVVDEAIGFVDA